MAKEKPSQGTDLISPDKIKKEPEDSGTQPVSAPKPSAASKTVTVLASPPNSSSKTSSGQPKTILLVQTVNNRTGGIQSLLLPQALRSLPAATSELSLLASRAKMSTVLTLTSSALKSQPSTAPKMAECLLTSATSTAAKPATSHASQGVQSASQAQIQAQTDIKSIVKLSSAAPPDSLPRVCELTFKSRTIKADGTVCTLKEYLCNFCQFMVASQDEFREHFMTHIFSCNYCSFRAFTRFEVLSHKKEKHQGIAEELAGYEGLDGFSDQLNSIVADWKLTEMPKAISPLPPISIQVPFVSSPLPVVVTQQSVSSAAATTEMTDSDSSSVLIVTPKPSISQSGIQTIRTFATSTPVTVISSSNVSVTSRLHSVSTMASMTAQIVAVSASAVSSVTPGLVAQKITPVVTTGAVSSPVVLPMSTIKTMASVGKSNDNYFTYKIVHDATGKVQAYECDVCSYRSTKINEIFAHASTHTINDLMKSNSNNVQWECFYCSFTSILQANVVSHVIAKHPNKPIQLKRMVSSNPTQRSAGRSVLFRAPNLMSDVTAPSKTSSPSIKKEKNQDETPTTLASTVTVGMAAKKTDDAGDGCMWGCYYCSVQSVDRNEIILHLKKDHAQQKLVITRRRITHIPVPQSSKGDLEAAETGSETVQNDSEMNSTDRTSSDVQIGDIDSTDPQHSLLKSRRKQVLPRKVPDDVKNDEAGDPGKVAKPSELALPIGKGKRRFQNLSRSKDSVDLMELKMPEVGSGKKTRRSREVNVEGSAKRMKLNQERGKTVDLTSDVEDDATIIIDGQEGADDVGMPALEDVSNFIKLKPVNRKTSTDTVVPMETCITSDSSVANNLVVNEVSVDNDKEMPVLHPELSMSQQPPEIKSRKHLETSSTGKQPVEGANKPVDFPDDFIVNDSQLFRYNSTTSEASCRRCTFTMSGLNARNHMREHCMSHTGGQLWKCPYCPFKCGRCSMIVKHVRNKHKNRPLNAIQRKIYRRPSDSSLQVDSGGTQGMVECIGTKGKPKRPPASVSGLRGPRSVKENHIFEWGSHMYECPFCSRRSLFKGSIKVHIKVAHPSENNDVMLKRLPRPRLVVDSQTFSQKAVLNIVPIESMHLYDSLGTLLLDNGTSLKYDLDIDDDVDDNKTVVERTGLRYQCSHCNFRNLTPQVIKIHILQNHPGESTTILDHRSGCRSHHLFLCSNSDCCFATSKPEALKMHACKMLEKSIVTSGDGLVEKTATATPEIHVLESQLSSNISAGLRTQNKIQESADGDEVNSVPPSNLTKSVDTSSGESRNESSYLSVNFRKRIKTPEGPIDYNDDGTLKGVDLENGSMTLQCRYCDYPRTSDPVEIKVHLAAKHPRLQPIAVDVDMKEKGVLSHLFICSIFGCDYSSRYSNVFEHHMDVEHPDVESVRSVKKKRAQKRNSDKFRIQPEVLQEEQNESSTGEPVAQENPGPNGSKSSSDCGNKDPLPMAAIASPAASTFSQPALSPVGTVSSEASNAVGDSPAIGSPDDIQISDSPFPAKDASKPGRKPRVKGHNFDFPCRYECIQCNFRVGSPEEMKGHLVVKHSENFRNFYCIDRRARELRKRQKVIFCRDSRCGFYCKFDEELENHEKYSCSFAPSVRHHHQKATQERVLQYMDSVMKMGPGAPGIEGEKLYQVGSGSSRAAMLENVNNKMYQCSHCTFITTDLHNIRMHVIAEHASTEGGFAEIKTELGTDGNIVMNVNDRGVNELNKSAMNMNLVCDKTVDRESRSMYDAVDTVKVDDEEKVYTVL